MTTGLDATRLEAPDLVRGLAVGGLVMTNVPLILTGVRYRQVAGGPLYPGPLADTVAYTAFVWMPAMVGISMFVLVMGLGLARADDRGAGRRAVTSRFVVLAVVGAVHGLLIWWGDILVYYAVAGLVLTPLLHRPPAILAGVGALLLSAPAAVTLADAAGQAGDVAPAVADRIAAASRAVAAEAGPAAANYRSGDLVHILGQRAADWWAYVQDFAPLGLPQVMGTMLLGCAAARCALFDPANRDHRIWRLCARQLGVVAVLTAIVGYLVRATDDRVVSPALSLGATADLLSAPLLAIWITALAVRHAPTARPHAVRRGITAVGRYSITVYVLCSVVCAAIAYGAGQYDRVSLGRALALAFAANALVAVLCAAAAARGRTGPVEFAVRRCADALAAGRSGKDDR